MLFSMTYFKLCPERENLFFLVKIYLCYSACSHQKHEEHLYFLENGHSSFSEVTSYYSGDHTLPGISKNSKMLKKWTGEKNYKNSCLSGF